MISPIKITLDFYQNNIVMLNAKQLDNSRSVNITCADNGRKVELNKDTMSIYIGCTKSDGNYGFYDAQILDDGTILWEINEQVLAKPGKQKADVCVIATNGTVVDNLIDITSATDLGVSLISTMPLYINNIATAIDHDKINSVSEIDALNTALTRLAYTEQHLKEVDSTLSNNEETRKSNEESRVNAEIKRENDTQEAITRCNNATDSANEATKNANAATSNCNAVINNANTVIEKTNTVINNCENTIIKANEATSKATDAAKLCESVVDKSGIVLKTEKGVANGVATLDEDVKIPTSQLPFSIVNNTTTEVAGTVLDGRVGKSLSNNISELLKKLDSLQKQVDAMPVIYHGTDAPTSSIGKDGDIYFRIITE